MPVLTLITEQVLARVPGGTGRYTREIAAAVGASAPPDWQVRGLTAWHRQARAARIPGLTRTRRLPIGSRVLARVWERGLPPAVAGSVVHALTPLAPARLGAGQALVVTVHDAVPFSHPETLTPHGAAWHRSMIERACRIAAAVVVPTRSVADELAAAGIGGRIEVIGEGTSAALGIRMTPDGIEATRRRFGLPDRYLLSVGTLEPRKGLDVLLDALASPALAGGEWAGLQLAVVGQPGWGDTDVAAEAVRRGIGDRVKVLGRLPDADLAEVMSAASVAVMPSRSEGFGLPLLEAMSRGIPVVHSDAPALVEVAGGAGVAVPVGDVAALAVAIADVLSRPADAARMSIAGRLRAADFSWDLAAVDLWKLYLDLAR